MTDQWISLLQLSRSVLLPPSFLVDLIDSSRIRLPSTSTTAADGNMGMNETTSASTFLNQLPSREHHQHLSMLTSFGRYITSLSLCPLSLSSLLPRHAPSLYCLFLPFCFLFFGLSVSSPPARTSPPSSVAALWPTPSRLLDGVSDCLALIPAYFVCPSVLWFVCFVFLSVYVAFYGSLACPSLSCHSAK